jgi:hypothetical protein
LQQAQTRVSVLLKKVPKVLGRENRSWQDTEMQSAACAAGKGRSCF